MLGMISCEKTYTYSVVGESFVNYEHYKTVIKFDTNSVVSIKVFNIEDSLMLVDWGTYIQIDDEISIDRGNGPYIPMNGKLMSDSKLLMHVGTTSETIFCRL